MISTLGPVRDIHGAQKISDGQSRSSIFDLVNPLVESTWMCLLRICLRKLRGINRNAAGELVRRYVSSMSVIVLVSRKPTVPVTSHW